MAGTEPDTPLRCSGMEDDRNTSRSVGETGVGIGNGSSLAVGPPMDKGNEPGSFEAYPPWFGSGSDTLQATMLAAVSTLKTAVVGGLSDSTVSTPPATGQYSAIVANNRH